MKPSIQYKLLNLLDLAMHSLKASELLVANNWLATFQQALMTHDSKKALCIPPDNYDHIKQSVERLTVICRELEFAASVDAAERLRELINAAALMHKDGKSWMRFTQLDADKLYNHFRDLVGRLSDDFKRPIVLAIPYSKTSFYEPTEPLFGSDFTANFSSHGVFELDEAAKCLALNRPTACVFHLMRILEIAIDALRLSLGLAQRAKNNKNWGAILGDIHDEIKRRDAMKPTPQWKLVNDSATFHQSYALLDAVKNVWRNPSMHVEGKYLPDEAMDIFNMTKSFVRNLAKRMDEQGQPLA